MKEYPVIDTSYTAMLESAKINKTKVNGHI